MHLRKCHLLHNLHTMQEDHRFLEHVRDEEKTTHVSKPIVRHFNLSNHSHHNITICGLSLNHGNTESRKNLEQKFFFQLGTLYHTESMNQWQSSSTHIKANNTLNSSIRSDKGLNARNVAFYLSRW